MIIWRGEQRSLVFSIFLFSITAIAQPQTEELSFIHYSNKDGLPSTYIKDIEQDIYGFIWLANRETLCRFDGYNFRSFPATDSAGHTVNLRANTMDLINDTLLVARNIDNDFYYFDYKSENFRYLRALNRLGAGQLITDRLLLYHTDTHVYRLTVKPDMSISSEEIFSETQVNHSIKLVDVRDYRYVLVTTNGSQDFINYFDGGKFTQYEAPLPSLSMVYLDSYGHIWVNDNENGLARLMPYKEDVRIYTQNNEDENLRITHNYVHVMEEDSEGTIWLGTEGGLTRWSPEGEKISRSVFSITNPQGLSSNPIYSAFCDRDGNVWLGTYFSGINLWAKRKPFFKTISPGIGDQFLGGNAVSSFAEDDEGNIWIGLEDLGINKLNTADGTIDKDPVKSLNNGLSYGNVHDLYFADPDHLWIATYTGGINIFDLRDKSIRYVNTRNTPALMSNDIYSFLDVGDSVFVTTINGINVYRKSTGLFTRFFTDVFDGVMVEKAALSHGKVWLSSRTQVHYYDLKTQKLHNFDRAGRLQGVNFVKSDNKQRLWIGDSFEGLFCYDGQKDTIYRFSPETTGFPGSWIYGLQQGFGEIFWVSTNEGLVRLDFETGEAVLFNSDTGIPFSQFNYRAAFKDSRGTIYFGSNEGLVYFDERAKVVDDRSNQVVLTNLKLFNQAVEPDESTPILDRSITQADLIRLDYDQNVFTIEFSALNFLNQGKCNYAYYLEGFESDYNYMGNQNFATYTNLGPGTYKFHVKASFDNSSWDEESTMLVIRVKPPFWLSPLGFVFYVAVLAAILIMISVVTSRIQKSRAIATLERKERIHAVEMNQIKLEFFTNISHELRTPLTLIIGPVSKLLADEKVSPYVKDKLRGIDINAHRLLDLVNQLLEFRKIEQGKENLRVVHTSIDRLFNNLKQSFESTATDHDIELVFECDEARDPVWFDLARVEKMLINLISNAFKFTPANGTITVTAQLADNSSGHQILKLTVKDTGKGMEPRVVNRIFDRFYQSESNSIEGYYGSGIGLAFVQSLVKLHRGKIFVKSKSGVGTIFKIDLPVERSDYDDTEISTPESEHHPVQEMQKLSAKKPDNGTAVSNSQGKPRILLIEDNEELIDFIAGSLSDTYDITKAHNGVEALEKMKDRQIDLIICDVMMPEMDGFEFTSKVKSSFETSHIPVIMLTAKTGDENRYEGLKTGADIYLEKPFLAHILEQNIHNLLITRDSLIRKFKKDAMMPVTDLTQSESDREFIDKLTNIIKSNIDKAGLDVSFLTSQIGLSRTMLHLKLKKIADCSATEFINTVRLKEAVRLMVDKNCNVSEAAYQTGFSSPTYFTRRFKQYFGQSPRDFLQKRSDD